MVDLPDGPTEESTERDGLLSYSAEWHAFSHGIYDGMRSPRPRPSGLPDNRDVEKEPHYYKGAYVIGTLLQLGILVVAGAGGLTMPKKLTMQNGTVRDANPKLRLACTRCRDWREFDRKSDTAVRCAECGKRHSTDSLWDVNVAGVKL